MNTQADRRAARVTRLLHVLVVEADPTILEQIDLYLKGPGRKVELVDNGQEALRRIVAGQCFDLVILDCRLPDIDGQILAAAIKEVTPRTPIIMLTDDGSRLKPADVDCLLSKPLRVDRLWQAAKSTVRGFGR